MAVHFLLGTRDGLVQVDPDGRTLGPSELGHVTELALRADRAVTWSTGAARLALWRPGDTKPLRELHSPRHLFDIRALALDEAHIAAGGRLGELLLFACEGEDTEPSVHEVGAPIAGLVFDLTGLWISTEVRVFDAGLWRYEDGRLVPCPDTPAGRLAVSPSGRVAVAARDHVYLREPDGTVARLDTPASDVAFVDDERLVVVWRRGIALWHGQQTVWRRVDDLSEPEAAGGNRVAVLGASVAVTRCGDAAPPEAPGHPVRRAPAALFGLKDGLRMATLPRCTQDLVVRSTVAPRLAKESASRSTPTHDHADESTQGAEAVRLALAAAVGPTGGAARKRMDSVQRRIEKIPGAADALGRAIVGRTAEAPNDSGLTFLFELASRCAPAMNDLEVFVLGVRHPKHAVVRAMSYRAFATRPEAGVAAASAALDARQAGVRLDAANYLGRSKRPEVTPVLEARLAREKAAKVRDSLEVGLKVLRKLPPPAAPMPSTVHPSRRERLRWELWRALSPSTEPHAFFRFFHRRSSAEVAERLGLSAPLVESELQRFAEAIESGEPTPAWATCLHRRADGTWDTTNRTPESASPSPGAPLGGLAALEELELAWPHDTGDDRSEAEHRAVVAGALERSMVMGRAWTFAELRQRYLQSSLCLEVAEKVVFEIAGRLVVFGPEDATVNGSVVVVDDAQLVRVAHPANHSAKTWPALDEPFEQRTRRVFDASALPASVEPVGHATWQRRRRSLGWSSVASNDGITTAVSPKLRAWSCRVEHTGYGAGYGGEVPIALRRAVVHCFEPKLVAMWDLERGRCDGFDDLPPSVRSEAIRELVELFGLEP